MRFSLAGCAIILYVLGAWAIAIIGACKLWEYIDAWMKGGCR